MRKIYSIVLMACAMLVSVSLSAAVNVTVPGEKTLQEAVNAGNEVVITLNDNVSLTSAVNIYSGQTVTLNLNGHNIEGGFNSALIVLYHGTLDITGSGTIEQKGNASGKGQAIQVEGQSDYTKKDWSVLTIGKDVKVLAMATEGKAVVVDGTINGPYYSLIAQSSGLTGVAFDYTADKYKDNASRKSKTDHGLMTAAVSTLNQKLGELLGVNKYPSYGIKRDSKTGVEISQTGYTAEGEKLSGTGLWYPSTGFRALAYGAKITINGYVEGREYGYKTNGYVGLDQGEHIVNLATIIVNSTATIKGGTGKESAGIASNGASIITIDGAKIEGGTGVYVKGGTVNIKDAVISSTYEGEFKNPVGTTSGLDAGGSGIVVETNSSYCGGQSVTISGDTKVTGSKGYGIQETVTKGNESTVSVVKIEGGTIEAGDQGAMIFDKSTVSSDDDKIQIVGGNVHSDIYVLDEEGQKVNTDIKEFIPEGNYSTTEVTDPKTGKTTIVVTELEDGVAIDKTGMTVAAAAAADKGLNWTNDNETLTADATLPYLEINANKAQVLTVNENVTLTVGRVVMGTQAQIIVKAGARLIVDGEQGIVATSNDNLVFQTKEGTTAQFLFNPAVTSNRHPNATVEFESKSYYENAEDYRNQRFGIPTMGQIDEITSSNNIPVAFAGYFNGKWQNLGRINATPAIDLTTALNKPFAYYQMSCNIKKDQAHPTITMKGALVGNESPVLTTTEATYTTFANSYMAKLDLKPLYDAIDATDGVEKTLWTYRPVASNTFVWKNYNKTVIAFEDRALEPMQAFYVKNNGNVADIALDYATMIWDARNKEFEALEAAPARRAAANNYDVMAQLTIAANGEEIDDIYMLQGAQFSAEFEDGWDSEKGQNEDVNLFISNNGRMGTLATNDMENTYLGFACQTAGTYTLRFTRMSGDNMVLVDLVNGQRIDMVEGAEYTFDAAADTENDYRFQIVGRRNAATALENTEAAAKAEGIYTLTGMYLGNMSVWNTLPAGIYVVNGEKMVK